MSANLKGSASNHSLGNRLARGLAAACTLVIVLAIGLVDLSQSAPGPLSAVHGTIEGLGGPNNCAACHGGWFGDMTSSCMKCHEQVSEDIDLGVGLHGTQPEGVDAMRCGLCHGEHNGSGFQIAGPRSFALAGVGAKDDIDHTRFGDALGGAHYDQDCAQCHEEADREVLTEGRPRFAGLDTNCASCHESEHPQAFPTDCSTCHSEESFERPTWRDHDEVFPRSGSHAEASCLDCHGEDTVFSIANHLDERGSSGSSISAIRTCVDCHDSQHSSSFLEQSLEPQSTLDSVCAGCHSPDQASFGHASETLSPDQHFASGFSILTPHADVQCAGCHDGEGSQERFLGRTQDQCASCHEDPHGGQFLAQDQQATDCRSCHAREAFAPSNFDADRHSELSLALTGAHAEAECSDCHAGADSIGEHYGSWNRAVLGQSLETTMFRGKDAQCAACHEDSHQGFFTGGPSGGDCAACHGSDQFGLKPTESFDHGLHCGFSLGGAHGQADCTTCHEPIGEPDETGRTFGQFAGFLAADGEGFAARPLSNGHQESLTEDCASCHSSPHGETFEAVPAQGGESTQTACAACHVPVSFRLAGDEFDHSSTGFSLDGSHKSLLCSSCHSVPLAQAQDPRGANLRAVLGTSCAACHEQPHAGQFAEPRELAVGGPPEMVEDCTRCHSTSRAFREPHFNHNFDSRFRLEGRHAEVACSACHEPVEVTPGELVIQYKPLDTECAACHGQQEGGSLRKHD